MLPSSLTALLPDYEWSRIETLQTEHAREALTTLRVVFDQVRDHRRREGCRHPLSAFLLLEAMFQAAGLCGRRAYRWALRLPVSIVTALGFRSGKIPARSTISEVVKNLDAAVVEEAVAAHQQELARAEHAELAAATGPGRPRLPHAAVDGKALRGTKRLAAMLMLVAVLDVTTGVVLSQARVTPGKGKGGEIAAARAALDLVASLAGMVITLDALHAQVATLNYLAGRGAHFIIGLKGNQKTLFAQVKALPWDQIPEPAAYREEINKGRAETRSLKYCTAPADFGLPHTARIVQVTSTRKPKSRPGPGKKAVFYYVTSLDETEANPYELLEMIRNHWGVEVHHYIRDVILGEDADTTRTGGLPWITAIMRNLVITRLHHTGHTSYRATIEDCHADPWMALDLLI